MVEKQAACVTMQSIICLCVLDFAEYVTCKGETGAAASPHSQRHSLQCESFKNPSPPARVSLPLEHKRRSTCNVICMCRLRDGLTDKLTPRRCISGMHAMSQMSCVIDRTARCLSERSLLSIYSREGGDGTERLVSTWSHFGRAMLPLPSPPEWVMSCCWWSTRHSM